ncbi:MAG: hypothetical protein HY689_01675 [Chloroflexi bacterium]|nr:hypothetical protein [Chloroflexota bacterium]
MHVHRNPLGQESPVGPPDVPLLDQHARVQAGERLDRQIRDRERTVSSLSEVERAALWAYLRAQGRGALWGAFEHGLPVEE